MKIVCCLLLICLSGCSGTTDPQVTPRLNGFYSSGFTGMSR